MDRFNFNFAPYNTLNPAEQKQLQKQVQIVFFDDNAPIIKAGEPMDALYVVIKGVVKELGDDGEVVALYRTNDSFEARALFEATSAHSFICAEQSLVYAIPKSLILNLIGSNVRFGAYFYTGIAERFNSLAPHDGQDISGLFHAKVADAYHHSTLSVDGGLTLAELARLMKDNKSKSVLVNHDGNIGLITESAFRDVIASGGKTDEPIYSHANFNIIGIDGEDFLFNALLTMMSHRIQRLAVKDNGRIIGLLEQMDILAYLSSHSHLVAERLHRADTLSELAQIAQQMTDSVSSLQAGGMSALQLAKLMQVLNGQLFEKAWGLIAPPQMVAKTCLIVMGSEGRGEQVLKTDQDNALIADDDVDMTALHEYAVKFSETLAKFGYPPCMGGIMTSNPKWCQTVSDFKRTVAHWCKSADGESLMDMAIFLDARAVAGKADLLDEVKRHLNAHLDKDVGMQMNFARAIMQFDEHNRGFFAKILGKGETHKMDIKKMGLFPVVHGVRALALKACLDETGTFDRLITLKNQGIISEQLAKDTADALAYLMNLRLKAGLFYVRNGEPISPNQVDTELLSTLERDLLKDALAVVKRFKHEVKSQFGLHNV
ncbi:DUF294 nucleotidyltransferase-like domain-containing protein [Moraxella equi]|uniref:Predicted signal-transduction protein containing cAMP-binding and CBS domains n=1 Tax=Moraxella equi TaxID=60442 RepID=A0A378QT85_9GAMM|nr:DUF294 nucleotidyltransferase-like domain-containing protein [Moraxella equi]OPH37846.1 hypothetical protein B5J93_07665 [Moraxella equi]STZ04126.1 Predicted signal-transduction protein containing cAMP-binding and CBS domains [Moraxella equi]